jgi:hypothetical protein
MTKQLTPSAITGNRLKAIKSVAVLGLSALPQAGRDSCDCLALIGSKQQVFFGGRLNEQPPSLGTQAEQYCGNVDRRTNQLRHTLVNTLIAYGGGHTADSSGTCRYGEADFVSHVDNHLDKVLISQPTEVNEPVFNWSKAKYRASKIVKALRDELYADP